jgi:hypothetical protein
VSTTPREKRADPNWREVSPGRFRWVGPTDCKPGERAILGDLELRRREMTKPRKRRRITRAQEKADLAAARWRQKLRREREA